MAMAGTGTRREGREVAEAPLEGEEAATAAATAEGAMAPVVMAMAAAVTAAAAAKAMAVEAMAEEVEKAAVVTATVAAATVVAAEMATAAAATAVAAEMAAEVPGEAMHWARMVAAATAAAAAAAADSASWAERELVAASGAAAAAAAAAVATVPHRVLGAQDIQQIWLRRGCTRRTHTSTGRMEIVHLRGQHWCICLCRNAVLSSGRIRVQSPLGCLGRRGRIPR